MKVVGSREALQCAFLLLSLVVPATCTAQVNVAAGAKTFSANCSGCHGSDGRGGERAPDIATARNISSLADEDLVRIVQHGVAGAGMPAFSYLGDQGIANVVAYLRVLQGKTAHVEVTGDASAGRELFFGWAGCSACHMVRGEGGYIGSDLSSFGAGIAPALIRKAIVEKPDFLPARSEVVEIVTSAGVHLSGVLRSEDNFQVVVQDANGSFHRYSKSGLKKLTHTGRTLMPSDYGTRLSSQQVDDLVSYLVRAAGATTSSRSHRKEADE